MFICSLISWPLIVALILKMELRISAYRLDNPEKMSRIPRLNAVSIQTEASNYAS